MSTVVLPAHYDGERIILDEPYDLPLDATLTVIVRAPDREIVSEDAWLSAAASNEAFAFLADPAEDIYSLEDGEPLRDEI